jgi:predicted N-acetyltransferase YhbS
MRVPSVATKAGVRIRAVSESDLKALAELQYRSSRAGYPLRLRIQAWVYKAGFPTVVRLLWGDGSRLFLLAENVDGILGYVAFAKGEEGEAELLAAFVEPSHWRRGIGSQLVTEGVKVLELSGTRLVSVVSNPLSVPFYEAIGFELAGTANVPHHRNAPRLVMHLAR